MIFTETRLKGAFVVEVKKSGRRPWIFWQGLVSE